MRYEIWKLPASHPNKFMHLEWCRQKIKLTDYVMVYSGEFELCDELEVELDKLFEKFNIDFPRDYHSESMCVSDLICVFDESQRREWYFIDGIGFKHININI